MNKKICKVDFHSSQDDVMTRKHFLYYWPFVRGILQLIPPTKVQLSRSLTRSLAWPTSCWTNSQVANDLRHYESHVTSLCNALEWHHNDGVSNHQPHDCILIQAKKTKKTSKLHVTGPLCGEFTGDWWIPHTKGQWRGKCFHLMTSSWCSGVPYFRNAPDHCSGLRCVTTAHLHTLRTNIDFQLFQIKKHAINFKWMILISVHESLPTNLKKIGFMDFHYFSLFQSIPVKISL